MPPISRALPANFWSSQLRGRALPLIGGLALTLITAFVLLLLTVIFEALNSGFEYPDPAELAEGRVTEAVVTESYVADNITVNNRHPLVIYYTFNNGSGEVKGKFRTMDEGFKPSVGEKISVRYVGKLSVIEGQEPFVLNTKLAWTIGLPILLIGLALLTLPLWSIVQLSTLYKEGRESTAKLVAIVPKGGLLEGGFGSGALVSYQYKSTMGHTLDGQSLTNDFSVYSLKPGDTIPILVMQDDERRSCYQPAQR